MERLSSFYMVYLGETDAFLLLASCTVVQRYRRSLKRLYAIRHGAVIITLLVCEGYFCLLSIINVALDWWCTKQREQIFGTGSSLIGDFRLGWVYLVGLHVEEKSR